MKNKELYFVTALAKKSDDFSARCFGYLESLEDAIQAVTINDGDIHECCHNYVVIEAIPPGLMFIAKEIKWFIWNDSDSKYEECEKPELLTNIINFAM